MDTLDDRDEPLCLATPRVPLLVPPRVFDGFAWCESDWLAWQRPEALRLDDDVQATNPAGMIFLCHDGAADFLPRELAHLHAPARIVGERSWALAPYAIDDATDQLYAHRLRPRDALSLYADSLAGLVWGLHDWAHFHNHGPFEERAYNELQCDASALAWLWINRARIGIDDAVWRRARSGIERVARARFEDEGIDAKEIVVLAEAPLVELALATSSSLAAPRSPPRRA